MSDFDGVTPDMIRAAEKRAAAARADAGDVAEVAEVDAAREEPPKGRRARASERT